MKDIGEVVVVSMERETSFNGLFRHPVKLFSEESFMFGVLGVGKGTFMSFRGFGA
jgi:hypothetical protein